MTVDKSCAWIQQVFGVVPCIWIESQNDLRLVMH